MAQTNFIDELEGRPNTVVFNTGELALVVKIRIRSKLAVDRDQMAMQLEIADDEILRDLQEMGFNRKTVGMLHLVPLIQVAWSEGTVTSHELKKIIEIARNDSSVSKTEFEQLLEWVNNRPSDEFFADALRIIRLMLESLSDDEKAAGKKDLISYCAAVANASHRLSGGNKAWSEVERNQIFEIAKAIGKAS